MASAAEPADSQDAVVGRAEALLAQDRVTDAIAALEQAYAQRQTPSVLYMLGRAHQRLGHGAEAKTFYERYLTADPGGDPRRRADAEVQVRNLIRVNALGAPPRPPVAASDRGLIPVRIETRPHHTGMLAAGASLLAIGYTPAFITGIVFAASSSSCSSSSSSCKASGTAGGLVLIPIVGPLISSIYYAAAYRGETFLYWGLPWILADMPAQVIGLALTIQGYRTPQKKIIFLGENLRLGPASLPGGGGLSLSGRF